MAMRVHVDVIDVPPESSTSIAAVALTERHKLRITDGGEGMRVY